MVNTLKITKLGSNKFEHIHNGISANAFFISDFSATLDGDKFNIVQNDGAVRFTYKVSDITFLDQTTGGSDEAFVSPLLLWNRLIAVQYTPFFVVPTGLSLDEFDAIHGANSPSASNVFATMADVGGGGGGAVDSVTGDLVDNTDPSNPVINTPTLQQVTDNGETTTNPITAFYYNVNDGVNERLISDETGVLVSYDNIVIRNADYETSGKKLQLISLNTTNKTQQFQDKDGDIALTSDIPDISGKEDSSNKVTTFTGNTTSTTKFPVVKAIVDWVNSLGFITNVATALGYTPANKAGETFTGAITATNLSGTNTGDETTTTIKSKLGITTLSGSNTGDETNTTIISKIGFTPENSANKGANNGYAGLDSTGKVPSSQLPSYVDDVLEFANLASFPIIGESGKIYIALDTNLEYRWSGTIYVNIAKGDVQSVNTKTGAVVLNTDDISESGTPTNKWWTNARTIASTLTGFTSGAGTVTSSDSVLTALQKLAGNISALVTGVSSVNTKTGAVTLTTADIADSTNKRYQTDNQNTYNDATSSIQTQINAKQSALGYTAENTANKSTDVNADQTSNSKYSTPKSIYDWATGLFATKSMGAYSFRVNNTNTTANSTETTYKSIAKQTYTGTITWTGTTAPSGTTSHSYSWQQVGNLVTVSLTLFYGTAGSALTSVSLTLPSDMPNPVKPDGLTSNSDFLYIGNAKIRTSSQNINTNGIECLIRTNSGGTGYDLFVQAGSLNAKVVQITLQYFTA